ncbi:MAG: thermonuclease family protein [Nitrospirota bacterium]|nr:thermonuclease family protein [Nitrospirota bacterium]
MSLRGLAGAARSRSVRGGRWPTCLLLGVLLGGCARSQPPPASPAVGEDGAKRFTGLVVNVVDGDTLTVVREGSGRLVQLAGIDCPELQQAFGRQAKQHAVQLALKQEVTVTEEGPGREGLAGQVTLPDGRVLNRELVRAGFCWWARPYRGDDALPLLEAEAHAAQRGLWADPEPVPPWEWRKMKVKPRGRESQHEN